MTKICPRNAQVLSGHQKVWIKIAKLKERLDRGAYHYFACPSLTISSQTSIRWMWTRKSLRELPKPHLTYSLCKGFLDAAGNENEQLQRIHERVNDLPNPNYATL
ncbi:hypothetical protein BKA93DRAFT_880388 [Sparassis latifolia]